MCTSRKENGDCSKERLLNTERYFLEVLTKYPRLFQVFQTSMNQAIYHRDDLYVPEKYMVLATFKRSHYLNYPETFHSNTGVSTNRL